jgi:hypothetical protein
MIIYFLVDRRKISLYCAESRIIGAGALRVRALNMRGGRGMGAWEKRVGLTLISQSDGGETEGGGDNEPAHLSEQYSDDARLIDQQQVLFAHRHDLLPTNVMPVRGRWKE